MNTGLIEGSRFLLSTSNPLALGVSQNLQESNTLAMGLNTSVSVQPTVAGASAVNIPASLMLGYVMTAFLLTFSAYVLMYKFRKEPA